jgi:hypothetical protein
MPVEFGECRAGGDRGGQLERSRFGVASISQPRQYWIDMMSREPLRDRNGLTGP